MSTRPKLEIFAFTSVLLGSVSAYILFNSPTLQQRTETLLVRSLFGIMLFGSFNYLLLRMIGPYYQIKQYVQQNPKRTQDLLLYAFIGAAEFLVIIFIGVSISSR